MKRIPEAAELRLSGPTTGEQKLGAECLHLGWI